MRLRNQTTIKRLTSKKKDALNAKPSLLTILLVVISLMQVPISLKASISLVCLFAEANNTNTTFLNCND